MRRSPGSRSGRSIARACGPGGGGLSVLGGRLLWLRCGGLRVCRCIFGGSRFGLLLLLLFLFVVVLVVVLFVVMVVVHHLGEACFFLWL